MDQYLDLITTWFRSFDIEPNIEKLKRQLSIIKTWFDKNCKGTVLAVTGFGKTYIALITIYRLNLKFPNSNIIVVVPGLDLHQAWIQHIKDFNLKNVEVWVVNSYVEYYLRTKQRHKAFLLIGDEVHNYLGKDAEVFNQTITCTDFTCFLGLSATLEEQEEKTLEDMGLPIIDRVTMSEARRNNYISNYTVYNLGISLDSSQMDAYKRLNDIHNNNFAKFQHFVDYDRNWELLRACTAGNGVICKIGNETKTGKEWRTWYAEKMNWNGENDHPWSPNNISKYAQQWNWAMIERKNFLYKNTDKVEVAAQIIEKFNLPSITFSENTDFADALAIRLGDSARAYHSNLVGQSLLEERVESRKTLKAAKVLVAKFKAYTYYWDEIEKTYKIHYKAPVKVGVSRIKKQIINLFRDGQIKTICTAKALDEGFDVPGIELGIIASATSKQRQSIQRSGRIVRYVEGKTARIINLYIKGTQDETWLKKRQKGETNIRWIDSINEIL